MVDPVVSSKYGKRPLLEVPALQVDSGSRLEISSLQERPKPDLGMSPALIYRSDGLNQKQPQAAMMPAGVTLNPGVTVAQPGLPAGMNLPGVSVAQPGLAAGMPMAQPMALPLAPGMPGSLYAPPPGNLPFQHLQPQPVNVPPMRLQAPPHHFVDASGNIVPMPTAYPVQQPQMYPGVHNPYQGQGYYMPGGLPPPGVVPAHYPQHLQFPQPAQAQTPVENFRIEGVLEYGQLTTVHFRNRTSNFHGLPEFLRRELQKTYGRFPVTDIRIEAQNGEFHVYATPRNEGDDFIEGGYSSPERRMVGFNEVRGDPR